MKVSLGIGVTLLALAPSIALSQAQITRVSPTSLQVIAGGPVVPLTIDGVNLNGLSSVSVLNQSGQPVSTVSGALKRTTLQPLGGASSLLLDIIAAKSAPAGTYQLELMFGTQRVVLTQVPIYVSSQAQPSGQGPTVVGSYTVPAPNVTSVNPAVVKLPLGGAAQTVVLNGSLLDQITAGYVARNGQKIFGFQVSVLPSKSTTQRDVSLTAGPTVTWLNVPLELELIVPATAKSRADTIHAPLKLEVYAKTVLVHRDDLFAKPINGVLAGAMTVFNSCGTPAQHQFAVNLPLLAYSAKGSMQRLEQATTNAERVEFLAGHSMDPTDAVDPLQLVNLPKTGHPSPLPHTVTAVRMCLLSLVGGGNWTFTGATETGSTAHAIVRVRYTRALFRARGMPADPTGLLTGEKFGIGWGHPFTDAELPDFEYSAPEFEARLPLTVSGGRIDYGTVQTLFHYSGTRWSSQFLGPKAVGDRLEQYAAARMAQVRNEIWKAFDAASTRNAISSAIMSKLQSAHGITDVLGIGLSKGDMWEIQHR